MEKSALFTFRQRAGKLEWKEISSVDVDEVVKYLKINELQHLLDTVTFSEISLQDVKTNNIENLLKLIQIMQLITEYLLFHQESQFQVINKNVSRIKGLKRDKEALENENVSLREDIKTYKRQLHILRKALQGSGKDPEKGGTRIIYPHLEPFEGRAAPAAVDTKEIVKTLVDHEYDSRRMMASLLEEQRRTFQQEMQLLVESLGKIQNHASVQAPDINQSYHLLMENMKLQFQQLIQSTLETNPRQNNLRQSNNDASMQQSLALRSLQDELLKKERQLFEREEAIQRREDLLTNMHATQETHQKRYFSRLLSLKTLFNVLATVIKKRKSKFFHQWYIHTVEQRNEEVFSENNQQLLYTKQQSNLKEFEAQKQYELEKERSIILQSKINYLTRELELAREKNSIIEHEKTSHLDEETNLIAQLKAEKEKNIILSAKFNTLQTRSDKEKNELLYKISILEKLIAEKQQAEKEKPLLSSPPRKIYHEAATTISKDFSMTPLLLPKKVQIEEIGVGDSYVFPSKGPKLFDDNINEDDLLDQALRRISSRNNKETVEQLAMATLTQEFITKFQPEKK